VVLPAKLNSFIPESKLYSSLLDFERKLDLCLARRQLDVQEALRVRNLQKVSKSIRLCVYNTYANQAGFYHVDNKTQLTVSEPPSWTLKIEGKLQDDISWTRQAQKTPKRKFTSFIKRAFIQLGSDPNNTIEWERSQVTGGDTDGWEIKRTGFEEIDVKIILILEQSPSKVKLSPDLSALLGGLHTETRPRIIMSLWQYVKANKLLDPNDRKTIINDAQLKRIFGCDSMQFSNLPQLLREHLGPPDPIEISYTIRLSGDTMQYNQYYDLQVDVDDTIAIQPSPAYKKEISNIEEQILSTVSQIHEHKRKREFMVNFHTDPINFMHKLIDNQIRDHKLVRSMPGRDPEEERQTPFYCQPYIEDSVHSYLTNHSTPQQPQTTVHIPNYTPAPTPIQTITTTTTPMQPPGPQVRGSFANGVGVKNDNKPGY